MEVKNKKIADFVWKQVHKKDGLDDERHLVKEGDFVFGLFFPSEEVFIGKVELDEEYIPEDEDDEYGQYSFECHSEDEADCGGSTGFLNNAYYIVRQSTLMDKYKKENKVAVSIPRQESFLEEWIKEVQECLTIQQ